MRFVPQMTLRSCVLLLLTSARLLVSTDPSPKSLGILVEYLNPSFHLVTAFADVGRYSKPQPFPRRPAWLAIQFYCPDLCRTHAQFVQGTCPSNKVTNVKNVKRYLNLAAISKDGLLVVMCTEPLTTTRERIIVPRLSPP